MARFRPGWTLTLGVAVLLGVLLALGAWQLERAAEKRAYQTRYFDRVGDLPVAPPPSLADAGFARVRLRGHYQAGRDYLVDNRPRQGQPGYWVVTRFAADDGRIFLVNRGWLAAPPQRTALPPVPTPEGPVTLTAVIWPDMGLPPLLAEDPWPRDWPKRVQRLDVARMAADRDSAGGASSAAGAVAQTTGQVVAAELRLEPGQPGVFEPVPVDLTFRPERHQAYAAQWFGLALVLAAGYLILGFRRMRGAP